MADKTSQAITVLEGLEAVRHRPSMYIGPEEPDHTFAMRLLEFVVDAVANDEPRPSAIRIRIHAAGAVVVAFDGSPLPIEPVGRPAEGVAHPALYQFFMHLMVGTPRALVFGAILNALSERLVVSTMHDGHRYRAVFSRGAIVGLLARAACTRPDGTNWLVYRADPTVITGAPLSAEQASTTCARVRAARNDVPITFTDHSSDEADWY
ncbi:MAG: hypothetical protein KC657_34800 [Myxococcales bacterium]|nr:hypothetical protein [Myxococcales bacterium]